MPHFTLQLAPDGPLIIAYFGVSFPRDKALRDAGQDVPKLVKATALIDTGASCTCVDPSILREALKLSPTGTTIVNTPTTGDDPVSVDQYDISLYIPCSENDVPLSVETLPVVCSDIKAQGIEALIGRDVLSKCILFYNGDMKQFSLAY
jgi:hypothetical protein